MVELAWFMDAGKCSNHGLSWMIFEKSSPTTALPVGEWQLKCTYKDA
jgi:hypothetical protein